MRIVVSLQDYDPPVGTVTRGADDPVAFMGWIGLVAAISQFVDAIAADAGAAGARASTRRVEERRALSRESDEADVHPETRVPQRPQVSRSSDRKV